MTYYWLLSVTNHPRASSASRLAVARDLQARIAESGLRHDSLKSAVAAAERISKNPLAVRVTVTRVAEKIEGAWCAGKKLKE